MRWASACLLIAIWYVPFVASRASVPVTIRPSKTSPAEHEVVAFVSAGVPTEALELEVRFDVAGVYLFRDQKVHSSSFVELNAARQSELIYFGSDRKRIEVHVARPLVSSPLLCAYCHGVLGLAHGSVLWTIYSSLFLSEYVFVFDGVPSAPLPVAEERLECLPAHPYGLCAVPNANGEILLLSPHHSKVIAPWHTVDAFLHGKNLYDEEEWEPFRVKMGRGKAEMTLPRQSLIGQHDDEASALLLEAHPTRNDTTIVGSVLLRDFSLRLDASHSSVELFRNSNQVRLPDVNAILFLVQFAQFVRWKLSNMANHFAGRAPRSQTRYVDLFYLFLSSSIAIASVSLPLNVRILRYGGHGDVLFIGAVCVTAVCVLTIFATRLLIFATAKGRLDLNKISLQFFCAVMTESIAYETLLLTSMWVLVLPRANGGVAGPLTSLVAFLGVYAGLVHLVLVTITLGTLGTQKPNRAWLFTIIFSAGGMTALFTTLFFVFFFLPYAKTSSGIYGELATGAALGLLAAAGVAAALISNAYVQSAVQTFLQQIKDSKK